MGFRHLAAAAVLLLAAPRVWAWGVRGHQMANRAAVESIPSDGPAFLEHSIDWIVATGPLPDSWRGVGTPDSKIFEDPNHGWFREQFSFMKTIPRSRYEFVLEVYDEYRRIKTAEPQNAEWMNVRWTGTLPYAAMENYDRMESAMRAYRKLISDPSPEAKANAAFLEQDIAFYMGWLGHYTADGEQPLHDTIQHDGWQGPNPNHYTTDPRIHGRFESQFVDLIHVTDADLTPLMGKPTVLADPFATILEYLGDSSTHVEEIYQMDQRGAFSNPNDAQAKQLVTRQLAKAATLLRDLTYTAWVESGKPTPPERRQDGSCAVSPCGDAVANPIYPSAPSYNPATGSAPPPGARPSWNSGTSGLSPAQQP
jgi:hypothetical protein